METIKEQMLTLEISNVCHDVWLVT